VRLKALMTFLRAGKTGRVLLGFGSIALVTAGLLLYFRSDRDLAPATAAPDPIPVIATSVQQRDVPIVLTGLGTVAALNDSFERCSP
jgi:membrane fusion protein, multidrug efflux system